MALRDSWHRTLVYFGLAEESDHDADYDGYDDEFEDGDEDCWVEIRLLRRTKPR